MLANKAVEYINRQIESDPEQPFFMYYCTQAVHIPHTPPEEIDGVKIAGTTTGPHGDLIRELDVQVGMLIRALKAAGVYDDTLFIFTSDNGGLAADPEAERLGHDPTNGLAQLKGSIMEGGHRVPFIARWPGKIAPGTRSMEVINALDVVATIAALTGQEICRDQVMDSINLMPLLTKQSDAKGHAVLVHHSQFGKVALRQGDWKLVAEHEKLKNLKPINLFNLKTNPKEKKSLDYLNNPESRERIEQMMKTLKYCLDNPTVDLQ
jgi:arylsulfatase A-like enzyme